jgi:hypothetical protein
VDDKGLESHKPAQSVFPGLLIVPDKTLRRYFLFGIPLKLFPLGDCGKGCFNSNIVSRFFLSPHLELEKKGTSTATF